MGLERSTKCEKMLVVARESNPGPLALATNALVTELQLPRPSYFTFILLSKVLEVVGCRSSVARELVAKARGPGSIPRRQLRLPLLLSRPL